MEKPNKVKPVNFGQQVLRQEQKLKGDNLESLKNHAGWKDINSMMDEKFRESLIDVLGLKDDKDILRAVTNAKAILDFAKSIGSAITSGEVARKLLEVSAESKKPCR